MCVNAETVSIENLKKRVVGFGETWLFPELTGGNQLNAYREQLVVHEETRVHRQRQTHA